jgi:hypothetical protein
MNLTISASSSIRRLTFVISHFTASLDNMQHLTLAQPHSWRDADASGASAVCSISPIE